MKILIVEPGKEPRKADITPCLSSMQKIVGGLIQAVYPFEEEVALICNEEGKLMGLPPNRYLRTPDTHEIYDLVVGTFFLCAAPSGSERFKSLTEKQIQHYSELFNAPEYVPGTALLMGGVLK